MKRISLNGVWTGNCSSREGILFEGTVPGSVLSDLMGAGIVEKNLFYRSYAHTIREYEKDDWVYTKRFTLDCKPESCSLLFERLDTYCRIYVNQILVGKSENGFISHRFDVSDALRVGENTLQVQFDSPIRRVAGKAVRQGAFTTERLYTRRMQCTYGWDWVCRFVTCGICGSVFLEVTEERTSVQNVYIYTKNIDEDSAQLGVELCFDRITGETLQFEVYDEKQRCVKSIQKFCAESFLKLNIEIENPHLWYPTGYGEQPLYTLLVLDGSGEIYREKFGIRTVKIMQLTDETGSENEKKCLALKNSDFSRQYDKNEVFSGFILKVNGIRIMCKGANWVPCEPFETKGMEQKIVRILQLAKAAGVNMIRVWGGGAFEKKLFYDECSRLGILVTQDFMMACGHYPEEESWFLKELTSEADYAAVFLRNQPCLVWWSGDNENAVEGCETDRDYHGRKSAYRAIAPVLCQRDPHRDFLPSSPYGGSKYASNTVGTTHNTQFLVNLFQYFERYTLENYKEYYKNYRARFIAEEPSMGATELTSLKKFMTEEDIFGNDLTIWRYHTQSNPALEKELFDYICMFAEKVLGNFKNGQDRFFKLKYIQYEWIRLSLEQARREKWFCSGVIYWMLNDCWPAASGWSLIDYYGVPKASYYSFRRCAAPVICSVDYEEGCCRIFICNDSLQEKKGVLTLWELNLCSSRVKTLEELQVEATANAAVCVYEKPLSLSKESLLLAEFKTDREWDRAFYKKGTLPLSKVPLRYETDEEKITVYADRYTHVVALEGDADFEDNYFSLMPGEQRRISYKRRDKQSNIPYPIGYTIMA